MDDSLVESVDARMRPDTPAPKNNRFAIEATGAALAFMIATVVVSHLVGAERSALIYSDGDSLLNVLMARSLSMGQPQDWALSPVLFIPEIAVYWLLSLLNQPVMVTLVLNAFVNLIALYAAIRYVAGNRRAPGASVAGSILAFGAFGVLAMLEGSSDRNGFELASLMATTTYYSATVVGVVVTLGLMLRTLGQPAHRMRVNSAFLFAVAALSTLSNPIYLAWCAAPMFALTVILVFAKRLNSRLAFFALGALLAGAFVGLAARVPFSAVIANSGVGYARPNEWQFSLDYYSAHLALRVSTPQGLAAALFVIVILLVAVVCTVEALHRRSADETLLAASAWFVPVAVCVGAILLGTHATRYLQPVMFMPILGLILVPPFFLNRSAARSPSVPVAVGVLLAGGLAISAFAGMPRIAESVALGAPNASLKCVTNWVDSTDRNRIGGGQFWTIRAPKAYIEDPRQLVQVDERLNPYHWLVNRADYQNEPLSFLITDSQSFAFELPAGVRGSGAETINCGSYSIIDFGRAELELGQPHS